MIAIKKHKARCLKLLTAARLQIEQETDALVDAIICTSIPSSSSVVCSASSSGTPSPGTYSIPVTSDFTFPH
jgi:hypothetical protein